MIYARKDGITSCFPDGKIASGWTQLTEEEVEQHLATMNKELEIYNIKQQLNELDLKSIRAIRANDTEYLERYENQAIELRERLAELI